PFVPHITEAIYQGLFAAVEDGGSLHRARWPEAIPTLIDAMAESTGEALLAIATAARRFKSEAGLALGAELTSLQLATEDAALAQTLLAAEEDLRSVTRAGVIAVSGSLNGGVLLPLAVGSVYVRVQP